MNYVLIKIIRSTNDISLISSTPLAISNDREELHNYCLNKYRRVAGKNNSNEFYIIEESPIVILLPLEKDVIKIMKYKAERLESRKVIYLMM